MKPYSSRLHDSNLLILLFHGVIPEQLHPVRNYTAKHITRASFVDILKDLKNAGGTPLSMAEVLDLQRSGRGWPRRSFAVTFDDGFENNFSVAAPVLDEMKISSTFYVTTEFVDKSECSWIDKIEYAVEKSPNCELNLPALGIHGAYPSVNAKIQLLSAIRKQVKSNSSLDPYSVASNVWEQLKITSMELDKDLDLKMTWSQITELSRHPGFVVGGHGHTHRILSYLSSADLELELSESFRLLAPHLEQPIQHYSYPEGLASCYSKSVIQALKQKGIQCCPSAEDGLNPRGADLFELKRVMVS